MAKKSSSAKRVTNTVNNKSSRPKAKGQSLPLNNTNSNKRGSKKYVEESEQDSEKDSDVEEDFIALSSKKSKQEDSEEDEEVFNLRGDDSDEDDEEKYAEDESVELDSDEDDESLDDDDDLQKLVQNLPSDIRQKVLMKGSAPEDSESEDEEDQDVGNSSSWGKKSTYWTGDTADLEIGQDIEDAEEEEAAAEDLYKEKLSKMSEKDFFDEDSDDEGASQSETETEEEQDESMAVIASKAKEAKKKVGGVSVMKESSAISAMSSRSKIGDLNMISLDNDNTDDMVVEQVDKDLSNMSKEEKLEMLAQQSPELIVIVEELKDRILELKEKIQPLTELVRKIKEMQLVEDDVVDYLEVKQQILLSYVTNVTFYLYLKALGVSVRSHPVMKQLLKLRYLMEKMRPMEGKLKYQIDRLIKLAAMDPNELQQNAAAILRPNPKALLEKFKISEISKKKNGKKGKQGSDDEVSDEENEDDESNEESEAGDDYSGEEEQKESAIYKAPRFAAMHYKDAESEANKRDDKIQKQRKRLKNSELLATLQEEFGDAPTQAASSGLDLMSADQKRLIEEEEERKNFEEDRFVRMTATRKEKQDKKRRAREASRLDNFDDIGDIGDVEDLMNHVSSMSKGKERSSDGALGDISGSSAKALQRALAALQGEKGMSLTDKSSKKGKKSKIVEDDYDDDDDDNPFHAMLEGGDGNQRKRRRAPEMDEDIDDTGVDLVEDFGRKKKEFLAKKKEHYKAEPRYGGFDETVEDGHKRAASYEIMKNKGLTPHRKKANRNPRVKKREAYDKAIIRRKGQVRDVVQGQAGAYSGELTGIKAGISRSRRM